MTTPEGLAGQDWGGLAQVGPEERDPAMAQRYRELAALPEEERQSQMLVMANAEYDLPAEQLRPFTVSRLRVWLDLEVGVAHQMIASYDAVMKRVSGAKAMSRIALEQTLAREFSVEDQRRLIELEPGVFGAAAAAARVAAAHAAAQAAQAAATPRPVERPKRRWWPFGGR